MQQQRGLWKYLRDTGSDNNYDNSHPSDGELKLQIFKDGFVNVSSPLDSFYDTGEIVIL